MIDLGKPRQPSSKSNFPKERKQKRKEPSTTKKATGRTQMYRAEKPNIGSFKKNTGKDYHDQ
jgi:hypothetical protein